LPEVSQLVARAAHGYAGVIRARSCRASFEESLWSFSPTDTDEAKP